MEGAEGTEVEKGQAAALATVAADDTVLTRKLVEKVVEVVVVPETDRKRQEEMRAVSMGAGAAQAR